MHTPHTKLLTLSEEDLYSMVKSVKFSGPRHPDATDLTRETTHTRESWRQGHPDDRDILTLGTSWRQKLQTFALCFFFFFFFSAFPRCATATLLTINVWLLWRKYNLFL